MKNIFILIGLIQIIGCSNDSESLHKNKAKRLIEIENYMLRTIHRNDSSRVIKGYVYNPVANEYKLRDYFLLKKGELIRDSSYFLIQKPLSDSLILLSLFYKGYSIDSFSIHFKSELKVGNNNLTRIVTRGAEGIFNFKKYKIKNSIAHIGVYCNNSPLKEKDGIIVPDFVLNINETRILKRQ